MSITSPNQTTFWFLNTRVTIHVFRRDSVDGISVIEHEAPWGDSPPLHVHEEEDEIFHLLEGEVRLRLGTTERRAVAGATFVAPRGVPHTYRVESPGARFLTITRGDFERFVRAFARPAEHPGLPKTSGPLSPGQIDALVAAGAARGIRFVGPPLA